MGIDYPDFSIDMIDAHRLALVNSGKDPGGGVPGRSWWWKMIMVSSPFDARVILKGFFAYLIVSRVALAIVTVVMYADEQKFQFAYI